MESDIVQQLKDLDLNFLYLHNPTVRAIVDQCKNENRALSMKDLSRIIQALVAANKFLQDEIIAMDPYGAHKGKEHPFPFSFEPVTAKDILDTHNVSVTGRCIGQVTFGKGSIYWGVLFSETHLMHTTELSLIDRIKKNFINVPKNMDLHIPEAYLKGFHIRTSRTLENDGGVVKFTFWRKDNPAVPYPHLPLDTTTPGIKPAGTPGEPIQPSPTFNPKKPPGVSITELVTGSNCFSIIEPHASISKDSVTPPPEDDDDIWEDDDE